MRCAASGPVATRLGLVVTGQFLLADQLEVCDLLCPQSTQIDPYNASSRQSTRSVVSIPSRGHNRDGTKG